MGVEAADIGEENGTRKEREGAKEAGRGTRNPA